MTAEIPPPPASACNPAGHPWRIGLRRPVFGSLTLAGVFFLCTAPVKQTPALYDHAPWLNDPFDTVISFMMFFVPLIALLCIPRLLLCRRSEPLPAARVRHLLRGCRVITVGVAATLITEWISLLARGERALVGLLRRHPLLASLAACAVFGIGVGVNQGIREGYFLPVTVVTCALRCGTTCGGWSAAVAPARAFLSSRSY